MTSVSERLAGLISARRLTQRALARALGVTPQAVNHWIRGIAEPGPAATVQLAQALGVTPGYIRYGDTIPADPTGDTITLQRYDFEASSGSDITTQEIAGIERITVSREWFYKQIKHPRDPSAYSLINVHGSSMSPTWSDGDVLLVDNGTDTIDRDGFYVFTFDGTAYAKRVQRIGRTLLIISDNRNFEPFRIEGDDLALVRVHGRVIKALNIHDLE